MSRIQPQPESDDTWFAFIVEQGWLAFVVIGIFIVGLRLFNMRQRRDQRQILRESLIAEMKCKGKMSRKAREGQHVIDQ